MATFVVSSAPRRNWRAAQGLGLVLTGLLLVGLVSRSALTLHVLWDMVIPLLPAVFLVNPMLWRNVCPLATLNAYTGQRMATARLGGRRLRASWAIGIVLLVVMVPARRILFNVNGPALAITIVTVAVLATGAGAMYSRRAGFCNAICPVLPVEKLYGQSPLLRVASARCGDCNVCTPIGCIDLAGDKTMSQTLGPTRRSTAWLATPFGVFAVAFPGFVIGYFTTGNGALATAAGLYLHVLLWSAASAGTLAGTILLSRAPARLTVPLLGGLAFGLYYWFAAPALARAYGGGDTAIVCVRVAAAILLAAWVVKGQPPGSPVHVRLRSFEARRARISIDSPAR